jgi:hypothetical protein
MNRYKMDDPNLWAALHSALFDGAVKILDEDDLTDQQFNDLYDILNEPGNWPC